MVHPSSTGHRRPSPRDAGATRQRLLRAALRLFTEQGYHGTTTPALARAAGIAEGTIYRHFPSKERLFRAVWRATHEWAADHVKSARLQGQPAEVQLRAVGMRLAKAASQDPAAAKLLISRPEPGLLDDAAREAAATFPASVEQIVAEGKAAGTVRPGGADFWTSIWLSVVTLVMRRVAYGIWPPDSPAITDSLAAAWLAIASPAPIRGGPGK